MSKPDRSATQAARARRRNPLLRGSSILLILTAAFTGMLAALAIIGIVTTGAPALPANALARMGLPTQGPAAVAIALVSCFLSLIEAAVQLAAGIAGIRLPRHRDTVRGCEVLGILAMGASTVSWLVDRITYGGVALASIPDLLWALALPLLYYASVRQESHTAFWHGIKAERPEQPTALPVQDIVDRFVLDPATGSLTACPAGTAPLVEFLSLDEYEEQQGGSPVTHHVSQMARTARHCSANTFGASVYGTILIPLESLAASGMPFSRDITLAFCLDSDHLTLVGDNTQEAAFISYYVAHQVLEKRSAAAVLFELLEMVVHDDSSYLLDLEDRLDLLEDNMGDDVNEIPPDFSAFIMRTRSELHALESFYRQASDLMATVADSPAHVAPQAACELFRALSGRVDRLAADARNLREYSLQIREMYQNKIDVRQNKVMTVLTIVTTIFMPLTLMTGWYGMNFDNMPELHSPYSYYVFIAVAVCIVTLVTIIFKRKKWF